MWHAEPVRCRGWPAAVFFGESISEADFGDTNKRTALQERLASLSKKHNSMDTDSEPMQSEAAKAEPRQTQFCVIGRRQVQLTDDIPPTAAGMGFKINHGIPQVYAASDLQHARQRIKMFDAITEEDLANIRSAEFCEKQQHLVAPATAAHTVDDLVPMVRDHLTFVPRNAGYVYDFYYIQQKYQGGVDPNVLRAANVGSVLWVDDIDDLLDTGVSSEDNIDDDEDSNAEDYYGNDYPDDPESESDMYDYYYSSEEREEFDRMKHNGLDFDDDNMYEDHVYEHDW
ncbi:hypothetical protein BX070DRAFT_237124 [Coemansia spiralis]|nr:hypothetical protein BX070DRAFT_237124 [Coemansia spiralis]